MASTDNAQLPWYLQSSVPVLFPEDDALTLSRADFEELLINDLKRQKEAICQDEPTTAEDPDAMSIDTESEAFTMVTDSTSAEIGKGLSAVELDELESDFAADSDSKAEPRSLGETKPSADNMPLPKHPFMEGLLGHFKAETSPPSMDNKMLTENSDVAFRSTTDPLVDLFTELEDVVSGPRLRELLDAAWTADSLATLKIIFNARSIHLGKSSRLTFYRAAGWLAQNHPLTLVANLRWLSRPVIEKKAKQEGEEDLVIVEGTDKDDVSRFDVKNGVAHGYWKDLLNILTQAVNDKLTVLSDPRDVLNSENPGIYRGKSVTRKKGKGKGKGGRRGRGRGRSAADTASHEQAEDSETVVHDTTPSTFETQTAEQDGAAAKKKELVDPKEARRQCRTRRHETAVRAYENPVYRALHLSVARLFAEQLESDLAALYRGTINDKRTISLCGKWAPSHDHFHDKHTFIASSIAEILHPRSSLDGVEATDDRETYLRRAREAYRKDVAALRKHLGVVERDITAKAYDNIKYERIPSQAMKNYTKTFIERDFDGFDKYLDRVASGKANISGATLLPSTLIHSVRVGHRELSQVEMSNNTAKALMTHKIQAMEAKVVDGQWKTLVQRIRDSGSMSSSIAVCDTSGSMTMPTFPDGTCPMDTAIGLSLLVAEVTEPPFGGAFITFSETPVVQRIDLRNALGFNYQSLLSSSWGYSTNFVAVFEDLILPMAVEDKLTQEQMVKRVFVFSDMQFDSAQASDKSWSSSFERIQKRFAKAGYEMPELIFWNIAGGRAGYSGYTGAVWDPIAPKPVTAAEPGTSMVSGYSQGMLKVFLDNGSFDKPEEDDSEDEVVVTKDESGGELTMEEMKKKAKMDPLRTVRKAIGHKAYDMLEVMD